MPGLDRQNHSHPQDLSDLYKEAAGVGLDAVKDQGVQLDSMRGRAMQFLAFIGTATAFLAGTAARGATFAVPWVAVLAIVLTVFTFVLLILLRSILTGTRGWFGGKAMDWNFRQDPTVYTEWLDNEGKLTKITYYRYLAIVYSDQADANEKYLSIIRRRYTAFLIGGTINLMGWGFVAMAFGAG